MSLKSDQLELVLVYMRQILPFLSIKSYFM